MRIFQPQTKYITTAIIVILIMIIMEILFINTLVSPTPDSMLQLQPGIRALYTTLTILVPLGILGVVVWVLLMLATVHRPRTYGNAHLATPKELHQAGVVKRTTPRSAHLNEGKYRKEAQQQESPLILGTAHRMEIALSQEQQESHILILAPTGRGKTSGIIIPNLLNENGSRSLFVNDVKHELIDKCIGAVAQHHNCYVLAPTRPEESNGYNPLAHVTPESLSDARNLAECIVRNSGSSKDPFWDNSARLLLTAVVLHLRTTESQAAFSRIADICTKSLPEVADIITHSPSQLAQRLGASFVKNISVEPKLQSNIMTDMATRLFDMMDPNVEMITTHDELSFGQIGEQASALFLHIPPHEASRLKWLSSCLIMQLINYLFEHPHQRKFAFYLDELMNIGYIPHYLDYISYIRSAGVSFIQVVQDFGQLTRVYEDDGKDTILANSGTKIFLSGVGQTEAEYASRVMGDTTVLSRTEGEGKGNQGSISYSEASRKLMNPDEVRGLPMWSLLILMGHVPPILARCKPYFEKPELLSRMNLPYNRPERVVLPVPSSPDATIQQEEPQQLISEQKVAQQTRDDEDYILEPGDPFAEEE